MLSSYASVVNPETLVICGLILLVTCYGIIKPLYIITQGYGFSISIVGASVSILLLRYIVKNGVSIPSVILLMESIVLVAYGIRLATFLRERRKKASYTQSQHGSFDAHVNKMWIVLLWLLVSFLYLCYALPVLIGYRAIANGYHINFIIHCFGCVAMIVGLVIEAIADSQKSKSKLERPSRFCDSGIYQYCRMPNYFGELLFWTGCTLSCLGDDMSILQLAFCIFGIVCAYYIMLNSAKNLDKSQFERYHSDNEYMKYRYEVPALFPFTHWYSMFKAEKQDSSVCEQTPKSNT